MRALSYILICVYLVTTVGFRVHVCTMSNSSEVVLPTQETPCDAQHNGCQEQKTCCNNKPNDCCCLTMVYQLDETQEIVNITKIKEPLVVLDMIYPILSYNFSLLFTAPSYSIHTTDIVYGPDGGITSITPLRL